MTSTTTPVTTGTDTAAQYPRTEVDSFSTVIAEDEVVIVNLRPLEDLRRPTEAVVGDNTAKGAIVWVSLAEDDAMEETGGSHHYVTVDANMTRLSAFDVLSQVIDHLNEAHEEMAKLLNR